LPQQLDTLETESAKLGYNLSFALYSITLSQSGPYQASYSCNITFNLTSADGRTSFARNVSSVGAISLVGIPDLYYNRNAALAGLPANRTFVPYVPAGWWNNSSVATMAQLGRYRAVNTSPDIFNRLQGSVAAGTWGIESLVPSTLTPASNLTSIDAQYFSNARYNCTYAGGAYASLRMNFQSIIDYNVTGSTLSFNGGGCLSPP
jgi:hypothetical protein